MLIVFFFQFMVDMFTNCSVGSIYNKKNCFTITVTCLLFAYLSYCIKLLCTIYICAKHFCKLDSMAGQRRIIKSSKAFKKYKSDLKHNDQRNGGMSHQPNNPLTQSMLPQSTWYNYFDPTKMQPLATTDLVTASQYNTPSCLSTNDNSNGHKKKRDAADYYIKDCKRKKLKGNIHFLLHIFLKDV